ncbi:Rqc2 family fibronectin-binding protein [Halalkalibacter nanhaiisediminis]|uniref:Rqc2 homolog RqcH n=1 Tax=Halalkalibacter nanhaiisediminis TaxID=688079 RepID=A0A562QEE8_9BACI|nr:NFACT RNA binding domain-containing protein [Halalkalibacter nanhaiisediminis]TWI55101.1 putative ribosome quality control (RQC) complex YloA/Tae2 family protein [Halalkalibacter nanhaiisediminis]
MSFDGFMTRAMTNELAHLLTSGRISKIYQPYKTELIFTIRANGKNHQLLLSANANFARIHLTNEKYDNPAVPPMFCMLLRKHLEGSLIEKIEQLEMERIIVFHVRSKDELGDETYKKLYIEIMGRHSNISLVDHESGNILDSIKHVSLSQSSYRSVLPGQPYKLPPEQKKADPFELDADQLLRRLDFNAGKIDRQLVEQIAGLSPQLAKEIVFRAGAVVNRTSLPTAFLDVMSLFKQHKYEPEMITSGGKEFFTILPLTHLTGERRSFTSLSELLDRFYYGKAERDRVKQQAHDLERFLSNELQKNKKKIKKLERTLIHADQAKEFQKLGELLTANLYNIKRGDKQIEVIDYYDESGGTVVIPLDPQKTPSDNAQAYFKRYNKAKNSVEVVEEQIKKANEEIEYFDQLIQQTESAAPRDIEEIREELIEEGYLRRRQKLKKPKKDIKPVLEQYMSSSGIDFFVGKNNKQNDYVTNKFARQDEIWLHTKDIPGSHVVIRSTEPDEQTLLEAATVAAYFSKARQSSSVPVDYTKVRHVKKPNGSKPGFVIYDQQTTIFVTPNEDLVRSLRK